MTPQQAIDVLLVRANRDGAYEMPTNKEAAEIIRAALEAGGVGVVDVYDPNELLRALRGMVKNIERTTTLITDHGDLTLLDRIDQHLAPAPKASEADFIARQHRLPEPMDRLMSENLGDFLDGPQADPVPPSGAIECPATPMDLIGACPTVAFKAGWDAYGSRGFADARALADWLHNLHEVDESGAVSEEKWEPAQRAAAAIRQTQAGASPPVAGEVERFKPEIVADPAKPYIHFRHEDAGDWMLHRDHARMVAAKDAEIVRLTYHAQVKRRHLADATTRAAAAEQRAEALAARLVECYRLAGADTTHASPEAMAERAVKAVADLRRDYDEDGASKRVTAALRYLDMVDQCLHLYPEQVATLAKRVRGILEK